ncbi:MAG: Asp-tRNA(Asn)/Glu-tRNA(Gln) amidotransferase subunit GatA [Candidatus Vogelbacteria bacterium]|nr:Asp-tRNA(Asn)/Glu-tRNA(Gln) amidotransferase subunit GatA [Candidatus Vogelbacteria bacterium]
MTKMAVRDFSQLTIARWLEGLARGAWRASELVEYYLKQIEKINPGLNAYLEVFDDALTAAEAIDRRLASGEPLRALEGVPIAVKDNILIKGRRASAGSKMLENYTAAYDATVIAKLRAAGAVFLGRTNMDEFAMGASTENSAFGPTKNPHDPERVAGGSSGGSAAALAAGLALAALGSDTGGSVRQPAAFCGVLGLKPTYGAVSRFGLIALAPSFDQIGPLARTADDVERIFEVIKGRDENDSTSLSEKVRPLISKVSRSNLEKFKKFKLGVPRRFLDQGLNRAGAENFSVATASLAAAGYEIMDIDLPTAPYALAAYYVIMPAEASSNLARYDGIRYGSYFPGQDLFDDYRTTRGNGFGLEVRRRVILGTYALSAGYYDAYYAKAFAVKQAIASEFAAAFNQVDAILTPTTPAPAFKLGERLADPVQMYLEDLFTVPANLAGLPAISIPSGRAASGLPFGLQIMAPPGGEGRLFQIAKHYANL